MISTIVRRTCVAASLVLLFTAAASAQAAGQNASGTETEVRAAQEHLLQAAIQGNKEDVGKYLADDVAWIGANGQVEGRDQILAALPAPVSSVDVQQVTPRGTSATLIATVHMKDGTQRRAMQEWIDQDGQWKVMAHESAPITGDNAPASPMETAPAGTSGTSASEARTVEPSLNSDDERAVWRAQMDIVNAFSRGDTNQYSKLTADRFTRIQTNGKVYDRSDWLAYVAKNAKQPIKMPAVSDAQIQVDRQNNIARLVAQFTPYSPDGTPQAPERQTRIFALNNGQWQQVAAISSPVSR